MSSDITKCTGNYVEKIRRKLCYYDPYGASNDDDE